MAALGVLLGTVGTDVNSGTIRFDFGQIALDDGVNFVAAAVGLFAFADVITHVGAVHQRVPGRRPLRPGGWRPPGQAGPRHGPDPRGAGNDPA